MSTDPATGAPLPPDAIQRILFLAPKTHIYAVPPLATTKGYTASAWTASPANPIFTARCRVVETAPPDGAPKVDVVLEDPSTGELFAAAPYTDPAAVDPVLDSSRFFALRVRDPEGRRAVLGLGFEERGEAFDFGVALQEARKALGIAASPAPGDRADGRKGGGPAAEEETRDLSLKEGETITVNLGGGSRIKRQPGRQRQAGGQAGFALPPPPPPPPPSSSASSAAGINLISPPPPAGSRGGGGETRQKSAEELGFDDGEFGEFA